MFAEHFKITGFAVLEIFLLALAGFSLTKKQFLSSQGLDDLSRLVMDVTLPLLIFSQLIRDFSFSLYHNWWIFPLISITITFTGLLVGAVFAGLIKGEQERLQFLSLVSFQNSGYLPLALVGAMLSGAQRDELFIYLFLFLMGFNLAIFSLGVHILNFHKDRKLKAKSFFSMPVVATLVSLLVVYLGLGKYIPGNIIKPVRMLGDTTLPLAMLVVGGNLAQIRLSHINKKAISLLILAKMVIMPLIGLILIKIFRVPELVGLLILIQLAMPSAVTISVILRSHKKEDVLASQGIFLTHIASIITIPVFLLLYFGWAVLK
jgi:predicted permease